MADSKSGFKLEYENRFSDLQQLDNLQHNPAQMKVIDFKQDYTVLIRKKLYYAINQKSNENYIKVFQINNFVSLRTSTSVYGKGGASVTLKGGERVVVADKSKVNDKNAGDWGSFEEMLYGWNNVDDEGEKGSWRKWKDPNDPDGPAVDYGNLMKVREQKYGWAIAEKCDFEPMDEIYIFGKSKREKNSDGSYKFVQIFFGYVGSVTKSYSAGTGGPLITIEAKDHTKLLEISRIANRAAMDPRVAGVASRTDGNGFIVLEDDFRYNGIDPETLQPLSAGSSFMFTNMFAGKRADEIIKQLCIEAGIPLSKLKKRIEPTERTPFAIQLRDSAAELFAGDFKTRLAFAQQAADIMNFEFFADEEGEFVWKIPNYNIGINRLPANNRGYDSTFLYDVSGALHQKGSTQITEIKEIQKTRDIKVDTVEKAQYTVKKGDTLWGISKKYYGTPTKWPEIYKENKSKISNPHWIYPGQVFTINIVQQGAGTKKETYTERIEVPKVIKAAQNDTSISTITDDQIPVIYPWEIIQFTFRDSDEQVYTAAEVMAEVPLIHHSTQGVGSMVKRAVNDPLLIAKYGHKVFPPVTTPLIGGAKGAEIYANLLLVKSLTGRYTGNVQMIEESSLRVGDPIRFHLYDQHPFPDTPGMGEKWQRNKDDMNADVNAQAVFYVDQIDRTIQVTGVSTMSLSLKAGRMAGMPSIYDKCVNLYRPFFEPDVELPPAPEQPEVEKPTFEYTVKKNDSLWKIAANRYGANDAGNKVKEIWKLNDLTSDRIYPGQKLKMP